MRDLFRKQMNKKQKIPLILTRIARMTSDIAHYSFFEERISFGAALIP